MAILVSLIALGFSYSFFHGVTGSSSRAKRMAVHEALLAAGLITGSVAGGQLFQHYSMQIVYLFCTLLLVLAMALQIMLCLRIKQEAGTNILS